MRQNRFYRYRSKQPGCCPPMMCPCLKVPTQVLGKAIVAIISTMATLAMPVAGYALPSGYNKAAGEVSFKQQGKKLTVTTQSNRAVVDYADFSVDSNETVHFKMPGKQAAILNRVTGANVSQIDGKLQANGQVFLANPNGIVFGSGSQVNVGSLFATTMAIDNANFMAGNYHFGSPTPGKSVVNQGTLKAKGKGFVILAGEIIQNTGSINAKAQKTFLLTGQEVELQVANNLSIGLVMDGKVLAKIKQKKNKKTQLAAKPLNKDQQAKIEQNQAGSVYNLAVNEALIEEATDVGYDENGQLMLTPSAKRGALAQASSSGPPAKVDDNDEVTVEVTAY